MSAQEKPGAAPKHYNVAARDDLFVDCYDAIALLLIG